MYVLVNLDSNRGGVVESNFFPASIHGGELESEVDSNTPPPLFESGPWGWGKYYTKTPDAGKILDSNTPPPPV